MEGEAAGHFHNCNDNAELADCRSGARTTIGIPDRRLLTFDSISIQGFGEIHLLVPTEPNVRESQNRHVKIIIR
jgi:hypothetical protein